MAAGMIKGIFRLISILVVLYVNCNIAFAWESYKSNEYNSGYSQSWEQYKVDNKIETKPQPTFWQNVGSWFSNVYESVSNAISNFVDSVKSYFAPKEQNVEVDMASVVQQDLIIKEIDVNLQEQTRSELDFSVEETKPEETKITDVEQKEQEIIAQEASKQEFRTTPEQTREIDNYYSVVAGAYKGQDVNVVDLLPKGYPVDEVNNLPQELVQNVGVNLEQAMQRMYNNENMTAVVIQTLNNIQNVEMTGRQVQLIIAREFKHLHDNEHMNKLNNISSVTKIDNDVKVKANKPMKLMLNNQFIQGEVTIDNPKVNISEHNGVVDLDVVKGKINYTHGMLSVDIKNVQVNEQQNTVTYKGKLYKFIDVERVYKINRGEQ